MGGSVYDEQACGGEMREKEKQNGSCAVVRGRMEEVKAAVRSRLMGDEFLPSCPIPIVTPRPGMLPRNMSGPKGLCSHSWPMLPPKGKGFPVSELSLVAMQVSNPYHHQSHDDLGGLCCHLKPWCRQTQVSAKGHGWVYGSSI